MSAFLYRLGRSSARHPFRVLGLWLVAAIAVMALQSSAGGAVRQQRTRARRRVPARRRRPRRPVPQPGRPDRPDRRSTPTTVDSTTPSTRRPSTEARAELAGGTDVAGVTDPFAAESAALSADGQTAYLDVTYDLDKLTATQLDDAIAVTDGAEADGVADRAHRRTRPARRRRPRAAS